MMTINIETNPGKCHNSKINISLINKTCQNLNVFKKHYLIKIDAKSKKLFMKMLLITNHL